MKAISTTKGPRAIGLGLCLLGLGLAGGGLAGCTSEAEQIAEHRQEAEARWEAGEEREALLHLRQALRLDPESAEINLEIAELLRKMDRTSDASFFYAEAHRLDPSLSEAALARAPLLYEGDLAEARSIVEEVLEREPDHHLAHYRMAEIAMLEGDLEAALSSALTAQELAPEKAESHRIVGQVYQAMGRAENRSSEEVDPKRYRQAIEAFRRAEEREATWYHRQDLATTYAVWPGHEEEARAAWREAFEAAREADDEEGMRSVTVTAQRWATSRRDLDFLRWTLERRLDVDPNAIATWQRLAILAEREEEGGGDAVWARALEARPQDPLVHGAWAHYLLRQDRTEEALAHLEAVPADVSRHPELELLRVKTHAREGREHLPEAHAALERLRANHPENPLTEFASAWIATAEGRSGDALATLREVVPDLERLDAYRMLAGLELGHGNPREALSAANRALEMAEGRDRLTLYRIRHVAQIRLGQWQDLLRSLHRMQRQGLRLGLRERIQFVRAQYAVGEREQGLRFLERLLDREEPPVEAALAFARHEGGRQPERAAQLLEEAVAREGAEPELVGVLAQLALQRGDPEVALRHLERLGEPGALPARLRLHRARALARLERYDEAEQDARAVFESGRFADQSVQLLVRILSVQDEQEAAIAALEKAREAGESLSGRSLWLLGRMYLEQGRIADARVILEEAIGAAPNLYVAHNDLAYVLAETGEDLDRARDLASQARSALPESAAVADTQGWVYYRRGMMGPAEQQFRAALDLLDDGGNTPLRAEVHYHLGLTLREQGRVEEAIAALDRALEIRPDYAEARDVRAELAGTAGAPGAEG